MGNTSQMTTNNDQSRDRCIMHWVVGLNCFLLMYALVLPLHLLNRIIAISIAIAIATSRHRNLILQVRFFSQTVRDRQWWLVGKGRNAHQSLNRYATEFADAAKQIEKNPMAITIDGGPHTLWWPHEQSPQQNLISVAGQFCLLVHGA